MFNKTQRNLLLKTCKKIESEPDCFSIKNDLVYDDKFEIEKASVAGWVWFFSSERDADKAVSYASKYYPENVVKEAAALLLALTEKEKEKEKKDLFYKKLNAKQSVEKIKQIIKDRSQVIMETAHTYDYPCPDTVWEQYRKNLDSGQILKVTQEMLNFWLEELELEFMASYVKIQNKKTRVSYGFKEGLSGVVVFWRDKEEMYCARISQEDCE